MSQPPYYTSPLTYPPDPTRRFGKKSVALELQAISYPGTLAPATEEAGLLQDGWVEALPALRRTPYPSCGRPNAITLSSHEIVQQTYVPIGNAEPVKHFLYELKKYIPKGSSVQPEDYFLRGLIKNDIKQPSADVTTFTAHPLLGAAMLQTHSDLGHAEYTRLPVNEALKKEFPNLVQLFTEVTDPDRCRTILEGARKIMHQMDPFHEKGLFRPVLELIQRKI